MIPPAISSQKKVNIVRIAATIPSASDSQTMARGRNRTRMLHHPNIKIWFESCRAHETCRPRRQHALVARVCLILVLALVAVASGCGAPQELPKQAEEVGSVAAEGSLLAHYAAEGSTTGTFTREHAKALRKLLGEVRPAIDDRGLARIAERADAALGRLAEDPSDRSGAAHLKDELSWLAEDARKLAS